MRLARWSKRRTVTEKNHRHARLCQSRLDGRSGTLKLLLKFSSCIGEEAWHRRQTYGWSWKADLKIRSYKNSKRAKKSPRVTTRVLLHTKNFLQFSTIEIAVEMHRKP